MATVHANQILTIFMLLLGGHYHCVKVSSDSETVRGMGLWEFSGALRELMLTYGSLNSFMKILIIGDLSVVFIDIGNGSILCKQDSHRIDILFLSLSRPFFCYFTVCM